MKTTFNLFLVISALTASALAHPGHDHELPPVLRRQAAPAGPFSAARFPDVQNIFAGNQRFKNTRNAIGIQALVDDGQKPPFMMFSCSDSRAPESPMFDAGPGTFFMGRNIANQYKPGDENAQSAMAYGVRVLGVQHVVVLGHYGCGGIAAAIATAPKSKIDVATHIIQTWIGDVRNLYLSSNRTEIAIMRERNLAIEAAGGVVGEPEVRDPGFRALVEENVKVQVARISKSSVITNLNEQIVTELNTDGSRKVSGPEKRAEEEVDLIPVFVHGWVHDLETGDVIDLNISTGPAGFENFVPLLDTLQEGQLETQEIKEQSQEQFVENVIFENSDVKDHGVTSISAPRLVKVRRSPRWTGKA